MISENQKTVGDYWSGRAKSTGNWWTNKLVVRDINRRVIGEPYSETSRGALELGRGLLGGRVPRRGLSVGCGNGGKEIALIKGGFVEKMLAYDLAESRIAQARQTAAEKGLADRIEFRLADAFALHGPDHDGPEFDFVYWNNSLHHMFDVPGALAWSRDVLRPGGLLLVDEFVGPSRMRFDDATLSYANAIRGMLPERLLARAAPGSFAKRAVRGMVPERLLAQAGSGSFAARALSRDWFEARIAKDPSEAVDSGRTLAAIADLFEAPVIRPTGGVVYFVALNGLFGNFDMGLPEDRALIQHLMTLDAVYTEAYPERTLYAVAAAIR